MSARGVKFYEGIKLSENDINVNEDGVTFEISSDIIKVDKVLLSIGRKPNTSDIGLNNTKIKLSTSGHILTNEFQQTEDKHIYAAGDCIENYNWHMLHQKKVLWLSIICLKGTQSQ